MLSFRSPFHHRSQAGDVPVNVGVLADDGVLEVWQVMLEAVALYGCDDSLGHGLRRLFRNVEERRILAGPVPDVCVDRSGLNEPDVHSSAVKIDGHGLTPAAEGEFAGAVRSF